MNATRTIIIPVLDTTKEMRELLELAANDDDSDFTWALDLDISHIDSRAQGFDVRVVDVEIAGKRIHAHLEMNYIRTLTSTISTTLRDGQCVQEMSGYFQVHPTAQARHCGFVLTKLVAISRCL